MVKIQDEGMITDAEIMGEWKINKQRGRMNQRWCEPSMSD